MSWFARQRQDWIGETLRIFGFINREHLQRKFGISQPQASLDLTAFQAAHPEAITYDTSRKCYVAQQSGNSLGNDPKVTARIGDRDGGAKGGATRNPTRGKSRKNDGVA